MISEREKIDHVDINFNGGLTPFVWSVRNALFHFRHFIL